MRNRISINRFDRQNIIPSRKEENRELLPPLEVVLDYVRLLKDCYVWIDNPDARVILVRMRPDNELVCKLEDIDLLTVAILKNRSTLVIKGRKEIKSDKFVYYIKEYEIFEEFQNPLLLEIDLNTLVNLNSSNNSIWCKNVYRINNLLGRRD